MLWVDRLTPEEFSRGFGSHTPMFSGQTKCVRYYMNCARGLRLFGDIIREQRYVVNASDERVALSDAQLAAVTSVLTPARSAHAFCAPLSATIRPTLRTHVGSKICLSEPTRFGLLMA